MESFLWVLLGILFILYFVVLPFQRQRNFKKEKEAHEEFLKKLSVNERVLLSSGIYGILKKKGSNIYYIEIAPDIQIEVLPQSIVAREKNSN